MRKSVEIEKRVMEILEDGQMYSLYELVNKVRGSDPEVQFTQQEILAVLYHIKRRNGAVVMRERGKIQLDKERI